MLRLCLTSQEDCIKADNQIRAILIFVLLKTSKFNGLLNSASFVNNILRQIVDTQPKAIFV